MRISCNIYPVDTKLSYVALQVEHNDGELEELELLEQCLGYLFVTLSQELGKDYIMETFEQLWATTQCNDGKPA